MKNCPNELIFVAFHEWKHLILMEIQSFSSPWGMQSLLSSFSYLFMCEEINTFNKLIEYYDNIEIVYEHFLN